MTIEEKLNKAIEFIKSIEKISIEELSTSDIIDSAYVYCTDCGNECDFDSPKQENYYVEVKHIDELKDKAWHLLFDLTD